MNKKIIYSKHNTFRPYPKPEKKVKEKATGEAELFKQIWAERSHWCENCEAFIREPSSANFDHIKSKAQRPDLRLSKVNIRILCFDCHFIRHNGTEEQFNARKKTYKPLGKLQ